MKSLWICMPLLLIMWLTGCQFHPELNTDKDWVVYKSRFIAEDGRVVDTGNQGVSHSEGQGYGLLLALKMDDQKTFTHIWQWTKANLQVRQDSLFIWRRRPATASVNEDQNNATDGDIIIAWALLEAAKKWQHPPYEQEAANILTAIKHKLIIEKNGLVVLLPGEYGFQFQNATVVNLSYWIYPAFTVFAQYDHDPVWQKLTASGQTLLQKARFGLWQLPPDWLEIKQDQTLQPTKNKHFGYDAVRVPLYMLLGKVNPALLDPFAKYWDFYGLYTPAWIALEENIMDSFGASSGVKAIKQVSLFALKRLESIKLPPIDQHQDYYSATLLLLSKLSFQQITH